MPTRLRHLSGKIRPVATTEMIIVAALVAGAVGMVAVGLAPRRIGTALVIGVGLTATAAAGALGLVALSLVGLWYFGVLHLAYVGLAVAVPLVGAAFGVRVLVDRRLDHRGFAGAGAVVLVLPAAVGWYATHVEPFRLTVDRVSEVVADERAGDDPVRIGVLADLQTTDVGAHERRAVDMLMAEGPDLVLLPGDLFQGSPAAFADHEAELRELLGRLHAPHGVYFVRGDVDPDDYVDRALRGTDIVILDDESVELRVGDRQLLIGGNRLTYAEPPAEALRRELESEDEDGEEETIRILVAHRPDVVLDLAPSSRVDLTIAGHTHGGQVVVPWIGPLVIKTDVPRHVAAGGLHEVAGNPIYVSNGVGVERSQAPQIRLFSPPSVGVVELRDA